MDYNSIYIKLNLRENKKRKTNGPSTLREELVPYEVGNDEFWDNLEISDEDEAPTHQEEDAPSQEETRQPPPCQPRNLWTPLNDISAQVDSMTMDMGKCAETKKT